MSLFSDPVIGGDPDYSASDSQLGYSNQDDQGYDDAFAGPPLPWLWVAIGVAVVGVVLAFVIPQLWGAMLGWALAGPVGFLLLALYVNKDTRAKASGVYLAPSWVQPVYWVVTSGLGVALLATAWRVADGVSRLW